MAKVHREKQEKGSFLGLLLKLAVAAVMVYLVVSFVAGQMRVSAMQRQLADVTAQVELQAEKNAELERLMASDNEDAYVERVAREKLQFVRPEERVFIDLSGE